MRRTKNRAGVAGLMVMLKLQLPLPSNAPVPTDVQLFSGSDTSVELYTLKPPPGEPPVPLSTRVEPVTVTPPICGGLTTLDTTFKVPLVVSKEVSQSKPVPGVAGTKLVETPA